MTDNTYTYEQYRALEKLYSRACRERDIYKARVERLEVTRDKLREESVEHRKSADEYRRKYIEAEDRLRTAKDALHCEHDFSKATGYCFKCGI